MKYQVFYKEVEIGILEVNEEGKHRYTPNEAGLQTIQDEASLTHVLTTKTEWCEPIPFFKNRIDDASRFSMKEFGYHTDFFRMKEVQ